MKNTLTERTYHQWPERSEMTYQQLLEKCETELQTSSPEAFIDNWVIKHRYWLSWDSVTQHRYSKDFSTLAELERDPLYAEFETAWNHLDFFKPDWSIPSELVYLMVFELREIPPAEYATIVKALNVGDMKEAIEMLDEICADSDQIGLKASYLLEELNKDASYYKILLIEDYKQDRIVRVPNQGLSIKREENEWRKLLMLSPTDLNLLHMIYYCNDDDTRKLAIQKLQTQNPTLLLKAAMSSYYTNINEFIIKELKSTNLEENVYSSIPRMAARDGRQGVLELKINLLKDGFELFY